jgi:hypothetical protein
MREFPATEQLPSRTPRSTNREKHENREMGTGFGLLVQRMRFGNIGMYFENATA